MRVILIVCFVCVLVIPCQALDEVYGQQLFSVSNDVSNVTIKEIFKGVMAGPMEDDHPTLDIQHGTNIILDNNTVELSCPFCKRPQLMKQEYFHICPNCGARLYEHITIKKEGNSTLYILELHAYPELMGYGTEE